MNLDRDLCILDTETLGLDRRAPVWEFAAVRLDRGGYLRLETSFQILHNESDWLETLPESFADDYRARYDEASAMRPSVAAVEIRAVTDGAIIAGSNPSFDMDRLEMLLRQYGIEPGWHFHPLDIPSMVAGHVAAGIPNVSPVTWRSSELSRLVAVEPDEFARHTALGDVNWCLAQWRRMAGGR
jgi:hypothetical protein